MLRPTALALSLTAMATPAEAEPVDVLLHLSDAAGQPVCDAQVHMAGVAASTTGCVYAARPTLERDQPFLVTVRHDDFVDEDLSMSYSGGSTRGLGTWTLRRPDEPYIIESSRRVAVVHEPDSLVVFTSPTSHDPAVNATAVDHVAGLATRYGYGLTVIDRCGAWREDDECLSKEIQLRPLASPPGARRRADFLLRLRNLPTVAGAGPMVTMRGNAMALDRRIEVTLDGSLTDDECVAWVESTGLNARLQVNERRVSIELTEGSAWRAVEVAEALVLRDGVRLVSNTLVLLAEDL